MLLLPEFSPNGYSVLLRALGEAGFKFRSLEAMTESPMSVVFLRHDVDIHIRGIAEIGRREAEQEASATYCIALTQPYNPSSPGNREELRELVAMGHRIGLHYDLTTYPTDPAAATEHLLGEVRHLEDLVQSPVRTISQHKPWAGLADLFATDPPAGLLNPHAHNFAGIRYVSDSCRAWRDEKLLEAIAAPKAANLLLNTHPELWLGDPGQDRHTFLEGMLMEAATADAGEFLLDVEQPGWRRHPGPRLHDEREAARRA